MNELVLGAETYPHTELLALLHSPSRGDASLLLASQLIAAKLNIASGTDGSSIAETLAASDAWLASLDGKLPYGVKTKQAPDAVAWTNTLDQYNNGTLPGAPPHCDSRDSAPQIRQILGPSEIWLSASTEEGTEVSIRAIGVDHVPGNDDDVLLGTVELGPGHHGLSVTLDKLILDGDCLYPVDLSGRIGSVQCLDEGQ